MKIRNGFVSNSSSSSFVVRKSMITALQADQIRDHVKVAKELDPEGLGAWAEDGEWRIFTHEDDVISGSTGMDNFSMSEFFDLIGISDDAVEWDW